jgi:hypothetical protein
MTEPKLEDVSFPEGKEVAFGGSTLSGQSFVDHGEP